MRASTGGRIAVTDFVRIMSQNPAKTFGLYPKKGTLRPGSDADMVLVDPGWPRTVPERQSPSRGGFQHLYGQTLPRRSRDRPPPGEIIRKRGEITGTLPGRFLPAGPILKG